MNSRAFLTAMLFGSAIAGTRLVAQAPAPLPQAPEQQAAADPAQCANQAKAQVKRRAMLGFARSLASNLPMVGHGAGAAVAGQATAAAIEGAASVDTAQQRCAG